MNDLNGQPSNHNENKKGDDQGSSTERHSDLPVRLEPSTFPHSPRQGTNHLPTTIENVEHLLQANGITARYNVITKDVELSGRNGRPITMNTVISVASLQGLQNGLVYNFVDEIAERNPANPVADWIRGKGWDGEDRLQPFYATIEVAEGYPPILKDWLMYRWLLSAAAAALHPSGFHARGVLTLQGGQGIGKTTWIANLINNALLRGKVLKLDHQMDAGNKDSVILATKHWIVEIGELDGSFKRDVAKLKGFLTSDSDKLRRPYARGISEYPRRTVFTATVNHSHFLVDDTGNSRFWTIEVERLNYQHGINMQQLFAQVALDYEEGEQWWLKHDEEKLLKAINDRYKSVSAVAERVLDAINLEYREFPHHKPMTASEVLRHIGYTNPTNAQCKDCGTVLREALGPPKRIQGRERWRVPFG